MVPASLVGGDDVGVGLLDGRVVVTVTTMIIVVVVVVAGGEGEVVENSFVRDQG